MFFLACARCARQYKSMKDTARLLPQKQFPLIETFKRQFKINDKTIFAYDGNIYSNYDLTPDLVVHEVTHLVQQEQQGLSEWVDKYLTDPKFRLDQEIEAYKVQLISIKDRNDRAKVRLESAKNLSSELYGSIISFEEALEILK